MNAERIRPYGLKSIKECISRATFLSQPTNISDFIHQHLSEMINFRNSHTEADPKIVSFQYQELWGKLLFKYIKYNPLK